MTSHPTSRGRLLRTVALALAGLVAAGALWAWPLVEVGWQMRSGSPVAVDRPARPIAVPDPGPVSDPTAQQRSNGTRGTKPSTPAPSASPAGTTAAERTGTTSAKPVRTAPVKPKVTVSPLQRWRTGGGSARVAALRADLGAVQAAAQAKDLAAAKRACATLGRDVSAAQAYAPIPDAELQRRWATALAYFGRGAGDCQRSISQFNPDGIANAVADLNAGRAEAVALSEALRFKR